MRLMAELTPCSKSTKVPSGQSSREISSRVSISAGAVEEHASTWKGWALSLTRRPWRRSSPVARRLRRFRSDSARVAGGRSCW